MIVNQRTILQLSKIYRSTEHKICINRRLKETKNQINTNINKDYYSFWILSQNALSRTALVNYIYLILFSTIVYFDRYSLFIATMLKILNYTFEYCLETME